MAHEDSSFPASDSDADLPSLRRSIEDLDRLLAEDGWLTSTETEPLPLSSSSTPYRAVGEPLGDEVLPAEPVSKTDAENRDLELLTRFLVGTIVLAGEELVVRARKWDDQAPKDIGPLAGGRPLEAGSYGDLARYLAIGMLTSGRRFVFKFARSTLGVPGGLTASLLRTTRRLTGSILLRPLKRPLSDAIQRADRRSHEWIDDGWREEQISRWIAANGLPGLMDDVIHIISTNPELAALVRDQISRQSASMASSVADTSRRLSAVGDDVTENLIRRILRRGPRGEIGKIEPVEELPASLEQANVSGQNDPS